MVPPIVIAAVAATVASCLASKAEPIQPSAPQGADDLVIRHGRKELFGEQVETTEICEEKGMAGMVCEPAYGDVKRLLRNEESALRQAILGGGKTMTGSEQPFIRFVSETHQECRRKTGYVRYAPEDSYTCIDTATVVKRSARLCVGNAKVSYCSGALPTALAAALDAADTNLYLQQHPEAIGWFRGAGLR